MTFEEASVIISSASRATDLFSEWITEHDPRNKKPARSRYRQLAMAVAPDKNPNEPNAALLLAKLNSLWEEAETLLGLILPSSVVITSPTGVKYEIFTPVYDGEIALLFEVGPSENSGGRTLLKIAKTPRDNDLLAHERQALEKIRENNTKDFPSYFAYIRDSFLYQDSRRELRAVNVLEWQFSSIALTSLSEVLNTYPGGLDGRDMAWIFRRLLAALEYFHKNGYVHGAVTKHHVIIEPYEHGLILLDGCYSVPINTPLSAVARDGNYPQYALDKKSVTPALDIAMAATLMEQLCGPNLIQPLRAFFAGCTQTGLVPPEMTALDILRDFDILIERIWGARSFRVFPSLPGRYGMH